MKRRVFRISVVLVILLLILAGAVQVILWTDLPRQWTLHALSAQLGMELRARSFSTSWTGTTKIEDLVAALPLEQEAFLTIPEMRLSHSPLLWMLLTQSVALHSIQVHHPAVNIKQDQSGLWNAQEVASLISEIRRTKTGGSSDLALPDLEMTDLSITITDRTGKVAQIGPLGLRGRPKGRLAWGFELDVPDQIHLEGEVASSAVHTHRIDLRVDRGEAFLRTWMVSEVTPVNLAAQWYGNFNNGQLTGNLQLGALEFGQTMIKGRLSVMVNSDSIRLEPKDLIIHNPTFSVQESKIKGGDLQLRADEFQANHLIVEQHGHTVIVDGTWDRSVEKGICNGSWAGSFAEQKIRHQGTWQAVIDSPRTGRKQIQLQFQTQGRTPWGNWDTQAEISSSGNTWLASQWRTTLPYFLWHQEGREIRLDTIAARFITDWPRIQLDSIRVENAGEVTARGEFSAEDRNWSLNLVAEKIALGQGDEPTVDLKLVAKGDSSGVDCSTFELSHQGITIAGAGKVALPSTQLQGVHISARRRLDLDDQMSQELDLLMQNWQFETDITGKIYPPNLDLHSYLMAENVTINRKQIPSIKIPLSATLNSQQITFQTEPFTLLEGLWQLNGGYDFDSQAGQAELNVGDLSLRTISDLTDSPLRWQGAISAELKVKLPKRDLSRMTASGSWRAKDLQMPPFAAEQAEGQISVRNGIVRFERANLEQKGGKAQAEMRFSLDKPQVLDIEAKTQGWPLEITGQGLHLHADGHTKLRLDVLERTASGRGSLSIDAQLSGKDFGRFTSDAEMQGRTLTVKNTKMAVLAGQIECEAVIPLDNWLHITSQLSWRNIDLALLVDWWPTLGGLTGGSSGILTAKPAEEQRPLDSIYLESKVELSDASIHGAHLGNCEVVAYAGKDRFLIKQSSLELAGGIIRTQATVSRHGDELFSHINSDLERLNLDQLVHMFQPQANKVAGYLTGKGSVVFSRDLRRLTGTADFQFTETDLVNNHVIATLYRTLNLDFEQAQPTGLGQISLRAEGATLQIPSFYYFNRGVEVRGAGTIKDLSLGKDSPIEGYAIGSTRPLKGIHLPGVEELDKLMTSLQKSAASVRIEGTLGKPEVKVVSFPEISSAVRRLLWGQLRK